VAKQRIDQVLLARGLATTRQKAQALIMAGQVLVNSKPISKSGTPISLDSVITVKTGSPYVGRGGIKLEYALSKFSLDVKGVVALDVGASTGGFTDCLLQHGASRVYAVDVGHSQMDNRLRQDDRVILFERTNARYPIHLPESIDMATVDVSFISLKQVLPTIARHITNNGFIVALIKPQFEAEKGQVGKGGVIRDPKEHGRILNRLLLWAISKRFRIRNLTSTVVSGTARNREFFLLLQTPYTVE